MFPESQPHNSDLIYVPDLGQVGAGKVVEFIPKEDKVWIPRPPNIRDNDIIFTHSVSGDSLYNPDNPRLSAWHGDTLICKGNIEISDIKNKVCIVFIQSTCERLAKLVSVKDGFCHLKSLNPDYPPRRFPVDSIEIKGVVLGIQHYWYS